MAFASSTIRSKRSATGPPSEQLALLQGGGRGGVTDSGVRRSKRLLSCHDSDQLVGYSGGASMALRACTLSNRVASDQPVGSTDNTSSDDDFQTAPRGFVEADRRGTGVDLGMAKDGRAPVGVFKEFLTIKTRCRPKPLVCAIKDFNSRQCEAVREIGFGGVLELQVTNAPLRLGYWLVTNFHPEDMSVHLPNGMKLLLTKDDVAATLGLPCGPITITEWDSQVVGPYLRQWRDKLCQPEGDVTVKALCNAMLRCKDGDVWFKRHFSVVVVSTLIASEHNGYVNQKIVHMLHDVDRIADLDWCGFLLKRLVNCHEDWSQRKRLRLVIGKRDVQRVVPSLKGWSTKMLKARESLEITYGGFGLGQLDAPLCQENNRPGVSIGQQLIVGNKSKSLVDRLEEKKTILHSAVQDIIELVHQSPKLAQDSELFHSVFENAQNLMALKPGVAHDPSLTSDQFDDDFWDNPDNILALEQAEQAAQRGKSLMDAPTFSLGLSQEQTNFNCAGVSTIAMGYVTPPPQATIRLGGSHSALSGELKLVPCDRKGKSPLNTTPQMLTGYLSSTLVEVCTVLWDWVFDNSQADFGEELFSYHGQNALWRDFRTLQQGTHVSAAVVDAWSSLLNAPVETRRWGMPSRLFASLSTTQGTVISATADRDERLNWFSKRLNADLRSSKYVGWSCIDLFVFPIIDRGHYYVMIVCTKNRRFDIIDNCSSRLSNKQRYGKTPDNLIDLLASFLELNGHPFRAVLVRNLEPKRLQMGWQVTSNKHDSGIYTMCHMELFTGQRCAELDYGLVKGDTWQILNLRKRYMHNIIMSAKNVHKDAISTRVAQYGRLRSGNAS
nr:uncharacterized protein LOC109155623 isoform X2 [Ipomoea batatas]